MQHAHRFVGRDAELHRLVEARGATLQGQPRVLVISGEAGVGKTRLVNELCREVDDGLVLAGGCVELAAGELPFAPFIAALRHLPEARDWPRMQEALGLKESAPATNITKWSQQTMEGYVGVQKRWLDFITRTPAVPIPPATEVQEEPKEVLV